MTRHLAPLLAALAFGLALAGAAPPAEAEISVDIDFFHDRLSPYGRWTDHDYYGDVWIPARQRNWRPYSNGRWVYTDQYGWLWAEQDDWGWATEHYGRWLWNPRWGWFWVPGYEWAPAWVSWRRGPDYIGWAPLAPYGRRHFDYDHDDDYDDRRWVFVQHRSFLAPSLRRVIVEPSRSRALRTRVPLIGDVGKRGRYWENRVIDVDDVERITQRRVKRVRVRDSEKAQRTQVEEDAVAVFRPQVRERPDDQQKRRGRADRDEGGKGDRDRERPAPVVDRTPEPKRKAEPKLERAPKAERAPATPKAERERAPKTRQQEPEREQVRRAPPPDRDAAEPRAERERKPKAEPRAEPKRAAPQERTRAPEPRPSQAEQRAPVPREAQAQPSGGQRGNEGGSSGNARKSRSGDDEPAQQQGSGKAKGGPR